MFFTEVLFFVEPCDCHKKLLCLRAHFFFHFMFYFFLVVSLPWINQQKCHSSYAYWLFRIQFLCCSLSLFCYSLNLIHSRKTPVVNSIPKKKERLRGKTNGWRRWNWFGCCCWHLVYLTTANMKQTPIIGFTFFLMWPWAQNQAYECYYICLRISFSLLFLSSHKTSTKFCPQCYFFSFSKDHFERKTNSEWRFFYLTITNKNVKQITEEKQKRRNVVDCCVIR